RGADGVISLREAITAANNTANGASPDEVRFGIAGSGPHVIMLASALPFITDPIVIDGSTEPDFVAGGVVVTLDGSGFSGDGLRITSGVAGSAIRGLGFSGFSGRSIILAGASSTAIGGVGVGNQFTGGGQIAVQMFGGASGNTLLGNAIGTDFTGTVVSGFADGIQIDDGASNNAIGGTGPGERNLIANNSDSGIEILASAGTGNALLGNQIWNNGGLAIDLGSDGVTGNDLGDGDTGPNNLQNFPVLASAVTDGASQVTVTGTLSGAASTTFRVEFFASATGDASGHGEAERFLGSTSVTTDGTGNASFAQLLAASVGAGETVTATATVDLGGGAYGDTSELAANATAAFANAAPVLDNTGTMTFTPVTEDDTNGAGQTVASVIASASGDRITDADGHPEGIAITGHTPSGLGGGFEYSVDGGSTWLTLGSPSDASARLLRETDLLRFVPVGGAVETASLTFRAWDQTAGSAGSTDNTTSNGGTTAYSTASETAAITTLLVNDAPSGADNTVTTDEDTDYVFAAADFGFSDPDGNALAAVVIAAPPTSGTLYLDTNSDGVVDGGEPVAAMQAVAVADITAGRLKFQPAADGNGIGYDSFTFQVRDDGGTANGGADTDPAPNTITVDVNAVNDAPAFTFGEGNKTYTENAAPTLFDTLATVSDADGADFDGGQLTVLVTSGGDGADRVGVVAGGAVTVNEPLQQVFHTGVLVGGWTGSGAPFTLTFNANADAGIVQDVARQIGFWSLSEDPPAGARVAEFTLTDGDGGTSLTRTKSLTVTPENDAPVITSDGGGAAAALVVAEGQTAVTTVTSSDVDGGVPAYSIAGGADAAAFAIDSATGALTLLTPA
ncbi:MAG: hypothetical protein AAF790_14690, partial [Planctomycetota bacterium]